jgi:hypothetical protein
MSILPVTKAHQIGAHSHLPLSRERTSAAAGLSTSVPISPRVPSIFANPSISWSPWISSVHAPRPALAYLASLLLILELNQSAPCQMAALGTAGRHLQCVRWSHGSAAASHSRTSSISIATTAWDAHPGRPGRQAGLHHASSRQVCLRFLPLPAPRTCISLYRGR